MSSWRDFLDEEMQKKYVIELRDFLQNERDQAAVYPPQDKVFQAMKVTPLDEVKLVILGQDPYHGPGQAMGLCFSVPEGCPLPPSLRNIFQEIERDTGVKMSGKGDLTGWAKQGVLLLNTLLSVREGLPLSHQRRGWEQFTDRLLQFLMKNKSPLAFLLWGKPAQQKLQAVIQGDLAYKDTLVLTAPHPSPLSAHRGFIGCSHFSKVNDWLKAQKKSPINWQL